MVEKTRTISEVDDYILNYPENIQRVLETLRSIILDADPNLVEEYKWSMPNYSYNGLVCYLQAAKGHVNLGFHKGNEIEHMDTNKLLQGTGKAMRHIKIKKEEEIQPEVFTSYIKNAVALNN